MFVSIRPRGVCLAVALPGRPEGMANIRCPHRDHPDGKTAYVANFGSGTVTPIRTATNTALTAIKVGAQPVAIAITPP